MPFSIAIPKCDTERLVSLRWGVSWCPITAQGLLFVKLSMKHKVFYNISIDSGWRHWKGIAIDNATENNWEKSSHWTKTYFSTFDRFKQEKNFTIIFGVWVNQRNRFLPNVCRFLLPARLQWVEPPGGGSGSRICKCSAENGYVNLLLPLFLSLKIVLFYFFRAALFGLLLVLHKGALSHSCLTSYGATTFSITIHKSRHSA